MTLAVTREMVEDLLYHEAALLDAWQLNEWLQLLTADVVYEVPPTDWAGGDAAATLFLVADDVTRLKARVKQLLGDDHWVENPRSRTRRQITNVRLLSVDDSQIKTTANFVVHRFRRGHDVYVGRYEHTLVREGDKLKIARRRAILDHEDLVAQGKLSIIL